MRGLSESQKREGTEWVKTERTKIEWQRPKVRSLSENQKSEWGKNEKSKREWHKVRGVSESRKRRAIEKGEREGQKRAAQGHK